MDYYSLFWGLGVISTIENPKVRLRVGHQHSQFWLILARFMDYYSPFWGQPLGALTGWLSTLAVFVDSVPFRGLLLTVLGPQSNFHGC